MQQLQGRLGLRKKKKPSGTAGRLQYIEQRFGEPIAHLVQQILGALHGAVTPTSPYDRMLPWIAAQLHTMRTQRERRTWARRNVDQLSQIYDWWSSENPDLGQYSYDQAVEASDAWHATLAPEPTGDAVPGKVVHRYPSGWTVQRLVTRKQLESEGRELEHCVGMYWNRVESGATEVYSLRDEGGNPVLTVEVQPPVFVAQIAGERNRPPEKAESKLLDEWLRPMLRRRSEVFLGKLSGAITWGDDWALYQLPLEEMALRAAGGGIAPEAHAVAAWRESLEAGADLRFYLLTHGDEPKATFWTSPNAREDDPKAYTWWSGGHGFVGTITYPGSNYRVKGRLLKKDHLAIDRAIQTALTLPGMPTPTTGDQVRVREDGTSWWLLRNRGERERESNWIGGRNMRPAPGSTYERRDTDLFLVLRDENGLPLMAIDFDAMTFQPRFVEARTIGRGSSIPKHRRVEADWVAEAATLLEELLIERPHMILGRLAGEEVLDTESLDREFLLASLRTDQKRAKSRILEPEEAAVDFFLEVIERAFAYADAHGVPRSWVWVQLSAAGDAGTRKKRRAATVLELKDGVAGSHREGASDLGNPTGRDWPRILAAFRIPVWHPAASKLWGSYREGWLFIYDRPAQTMMAARAQRD